MGKKKKWARSDLTLADKVELCKKLYLQQITHEEISVEHDVTVVAIKAWEKYHYERVQEALGLQEPVGEPGTAVSPTPTESEHDVVPSHREQLQLHLSPPAMIPPAPVMLRTAADYEAEIVRLKLMIAEMVMNLHHLRMALAAKG